MMMAARECVLLAEESGLKGGGVVRRGLPQETSAISATGIDLFLPQFYP
jgi:hypothetical protein